jgi:hypothetical protein
MSAYGTASFAVGVCADVTLEDSELPDVEAVLPPADTPPQANTIADIAAKSSKATIFFIASSKKHTQKRDFFMAFAILRLYHKKLLVSIKLVIFK